MCSFIANFLWFESQFSKKCIEKTFVSNAVLKSRDITDNLDQKHLFSDAYVVLW